LITTWQFLQRHPSVIVVDGSIPRGLATNPFDLFGFVVQNE
jgi:hypothetical protein